MSCYITTSTAEIAYYNDFSDDAKDLFHFNLSGKHYHEISPELRQIYSKLSTNVKNYITAENIDEQEKLWHSYDKFSQYLCDIDKYENIYQTSEYKL
jgi:hypothetical protein